MVDRVSAFPVHPTQIYEALAGILLLGLVLWARAKRPVPGRVFFGLVYGYGLLRFLIEFVRDPLGAPGMGYAFLAPGHGCRGACQSSRSAP